MSIPTANRNITYHGDNQSRHQMIFGIPAQEAADKPGILVLQAVSDASAVTNYYYWTDSNGVLRVHTSIPTNQDSDGSAVVASGAASTALSNLASVAINTSLISDTANTDDLGSDPISWRTLYWTTSLKKIGTSYDVTLAATEPSAASYTYTFPDAGADANVMLDTGAANVIAYTKGTSTIAMAANADLSIATGITLSVTAACTLDQNLAQAGTPTFASVTGGTAVITGGSITDSSGAISFGNENLTTTGTINLGSDNVNLTIGASGATDSRIYFDGAGNLMFYDSNQGAARSLTALYSGTTLNPAVSGDLSISDGKFTWTNAVDEANNAVWTFAGTDKTDISIVSSITTGTSLLITADACANGKLLNLDSDGGPGASGYYIYCYNGSAAEFTVGVSGQLLTSTVGDVGHKIARNNATGTSAVLEIEETNATGGTTLLIDSNATDANDAVVVEHDGTGNGLKITGTAVTGTQAKFIGPASQTASSVIIDGTTGSWIGAATTGLLHISSDGALVADASLIRVSSTGAISAANDGACLEVIETGAAQATTYAVRIASTSNEALHVDTGLSLFDERIAITLADNTGPALAITNPDTTGNSNAVTITPSGSGAGLYIDPQETDTVGIKVVAKAASTVSQIALDLATNNWSGAANIGAVHSSADAAFADVAAAQIYLGASDAIDDSRGHCLRIVDSSNVDGTMGYPVYVASNDATMGGIYVSTHASGAALTVAAGTASFAGIVTCTAGVKTKVAVTDVADPPTQANMVTAFGAAATAGAGFIGFLDDAAGGANTWLCVSNGTSWYYAAKLTVGA